MQSVENLNDLRLVAWIAETGSLAGAARRLGLNHATVFRRLNQLEAETGVRLFERIAGRYHATAAGEELMRAGAELDAIATSAMLRVAGADLRPSGLVRISTTDSLALTLLPPVLALCRQLYPQIRLTLEVDNKSANLSKRDADIAVRPTITPPDYLIGKHIAPLEFCIYAASSYLALHADLPLDQHEWIALDDAHSGHRSLRWLSNILSLDEIGYRSSSFGLVQQACMHGMGLAILPCILGDSSDALQRVGEPIPECAAALWLLIHPDLRETNRVKAVFQLLHEELGRAMASVGASVI
ncbi:LysR family transcriptional regulator [Undibacterium sp. Tian12W]|uniref:LysR family transcriptional regulator n=1 Tax=Undibacterium sp. Tian12W TaxID=3413054 RepID=UPI003BF3CE16